MHRACHFVPIFHVHYQASPVISKSQQSKLALQMHRNSKSYQALDPSCSTTVRQHNHHPTSPVDRIIMLTPSDFGFGSPLTSSSTPLASTRTPRHLCLHPDPVSIPPPRARPFISLGLLYRPPHSPSSPFASQPRDLLRWRLEFCRMEVRLGSRVART